MRAARRPAPASPPCSRWTRTGPSCRCSRPTACPTTPPMRWPPEGWGAAGRAEWFERLAHTAPLTGLANARTLARVLELEVARAGRQGSEVSVAVFDVDGFAAANAAAGTRAG